MSKLEVKHEIKKATFLDAMSVYFKHFPQRMKVARALIENGVAIRKGKLYVNNLRIPVRSVATVAKVDTRLVNKTIKDIENHKTLKPIFRRLKSRACMQEVGRYVSGLNVLQVGAEDASASNIAAPVLTKIAAKNISIRNLFCDDYALSTDPKMLVIVRGVIPDGLVTELKKIKGVKSVTIFSKSAD